MPLYAQLSNLIVNKDAVKNKYIGGLESFRKKYINNSQPYNQEDNHLFSLSKMNSDEFEIQDLINEGLSFDTEKQFSNDFTILSRYGGLHWEVEWIKNYYSVFFAHINSSKWELEKVEEFCKMDAEDFFQLLQKSNYTIVIKSNEVIFI